MSNFKVDNLECNTINGKALSLLGGGSGGAGFTVTEFTEDNASTIGGNEIGNGGSSIEYDYTSDQTNTGTINIGDTKLDYNSYTL